MYYIETINNKLTGKLECEEGIVVQSNFIEITKEEFDLIKLPFGLDGVFNAQEVILLQSLMPTYEEIKQAEKEIEMLNLLQEVL